METEKQSKKAAVNRRFGSKSYRTQLNVSSQSSGQQNKEKEDRLGYPGALITDYSTTPFEEEKSRYEPIFKNNQRQSVI